LVVADMAAWCKSRGTTLFGYLEEVQRAHGLFLAKQANFTLPGASGAATIKAVVDAFRAQAPSSFGDHKVSAALDYQKGVGALPRRTSSRTSSRAARASRCAPRAPSPSSSSTSSSR